MMHSGKALVLVAGALLLAFVAHALAPAPDAEWPVNGGTDLEQHYSPLDQINDGNASRLGLAWSFGLDTSRGQEATPIVAGGVMYVTSAWSKVFALDAKTGRELWRFDPAVPGEKGVHACCDVVNRGVAVSGRKVFVGTIDGRLIALNADTGKPVWSVRTAPYDQPYTITGAPRVAKGKVIIGNSGAEYGVRGYVTAYDVKTGRKAWRFYTVPGAPGTRDGEASDDALGRIAMSTWSGDWHKYGGGGTVWDAIVYDPELDQLYIGVGNGAPWNHKVRSAGKGDNLFLSSIVALDPDTGRYKWHYQTTPGDTWDYTATQPIILADLEVDGRERKVLMQAPKNGFFYVLDRTTGKLISAKNFVPVNWATGVDPKTGRPIETGFARYEGGPATIFPSGLGGHSWHAMAFSPKTGLVYIPAIYASLTYADLEKFTYRPGRWNTAAYFGGPMPGEKGQPPADARVEAGALLAWNPLTQKAAWAVDYPKFYNGGILATGGNLLFQGTISGEFQAFRADDGRKLWSANTGTGIVAAPVTYTVDGVQYVAILAGAGGAVPVSQRRDEPARVAPNGRVLVFRLDGNAKMPIEPDQPLPAPQPSAERFTAARIASGQQHYLANCTVCHGGYLLPDLRRSAMIRDPAAFRAVVLDGVLAPNGMASFKGYLTPEQVEDIRAYANDEARKLQAQLAAR